MASVEGALLGKFCSQNLHDYNIYNRRVGWNIALGDGIARSASANVLRVKLDLEFETMNI
jgi:hypothetical protein